MTHSFDEHYGRFSLYRLSPVVISEPGARGKGASVWGVAMEFSSQDIGHGSVALIPTSFS